MSIRVPSNQIVTSKYTAGSEFLVESTNTVYIGYYYELNNNFYAGKSYNAKSPKLIKIKDRNTLLSKNTSLAIFSLISGITSQQLSSTKIPSLPTNSFIGGYDPSITNFYCNKITNNPILIKNINEDDYKSLQSNPLYQTTYIGIYNNKSQTLDQANQQIPGLKIFLTG
jgi:hypothetical protein